MTTDARRGLPSVDAVVRAAGDVDLPRDRFVRAVRDVLAEARAAGATLDESGAADAARRRLRDRDKRSLRRVLNATGVVLQTNLGRAPLAAAALAAIVDAAGAVSVEYDLDAGRRGERHGHASRLLAELAGAEDGVVANNNAAAVLLALAALAARKEVIVARGELVEIGGGFRIPDVLRRSGAKLVEVGTTNRTYVRDYAAAINERTGAILRVHASNFKLTGFVARPEDRSLGSLAHERGIAFIHDLGSGTLIDTSRFGLAREETVGEAIAAGADVVTFSGDKLLGGPQAGLAVGRAAAIGALRSHPLMRAMRPDKLTLAALVAKRARALATQLASGGLEGDVIETQSTVGGGSLPEETQPSRAVAIGARHGRANEILARLRAADPPIVARIVDDRAAIDLRSVAPEDDGLLARAVTAALAKGEK